MRNATFRQLEVFVAAARRLSFARVAEDLELTPAAISFQIRQLEDSSGCPLFERIGKRLQLTEAGRLMLGYAETALRALEDANRTLDALKNPGSGEIRLGLVSTASYAAPHIVARFRARLPAVSVRLLDGGRDQVLALTERGEADLSILGRAPDSSELEAHAFAPHPYVIIAAPTHTLAQQRRRLDVESLRDQEFIAREEGSGNRMVFREMFRKAGFTPRIAMTSTSNETIKQAVMAGMGLAAISRHTIGLELGQRLLVALHLHGSPWMRTWFIAHRRAPLMPLQRQFRDFILAEGGKALASWESRHLRRPSGQAS